jgi:hypothetical protein
MLKDKIIEIVGTLINLTESGLLVWAEDDPNSKTRYYRRKMIALGDDGTTYEIEIKFTLNHEKWNLDEEGLWIRNNSLPNGIFYITNHRSDDMASKLRDTILKKYCLDMNPSISDVEDVLGDIVKGINISSFRDSKLNKILN